LSADPSPILPQLLLQVGLIGLNAFFASTEIAIIGLSENVLRKQAEEGDPKAGRLADIVAKPTNFLSTIQIGITLAGFLGSAFAADNFAERITTRLVAWNPALNAAAINTLSVVLVTLILAFFTLIFGELVPKRIAMQKPDKVARFSAGVVYGVSRLMRPVVWLMSACTNGVLRLLHIDPNAVVDDVSEESIRMMVDIGGDSGAIGAEEQAFIENIFDFNDTSAEDIMIHRTDMVSLWAEEKPEDIFRSIEDTGLSRFPVYDEDVDDIIGILNTRDYLLNARMAQPKALKKLLRPAYFVPETVKTDILFRDMQSKKVHLAIVVDEYGGTSGLVTMEDLLEEIVGNIYDEFDPQDEQEIIPLEDGGWRMAGSATLERISEATGAELDGEDEYDTLGGLVFTQLSVIPQDGSTFTVEACGLRISVEQFQDRRVEWALVRLIAPAEQTKQTSGEHEK
jgi:Hemolysins and related proteins containing CBS domains